MRPDLFTHTLNLIRRGTVAAELSEQLAELVAECRDTGRPGSITVEIKIRPQGSSGQYFATAKSKIRAPSGPSEETLLFCTPDGNLTREDPRQEKLPLRSVEDPGTGPLKEVSP